ncbi:MAG: outer membrane lipoprotein carrier protein LolA [Bdellovibrionota bacterium]
MYYIYICILFFVSGQAYGLDQTARLQKELSALKNIRTDFTQTIVSSRFGDEKAQGTVTIVKPDKMRWIYEVPEGRIFLADGTTFYRYDAKDKVEQKSSQKELMQDPASFFFLWDNIQLKDHFTVSKKSTNNQQTTLYADSQRSAKRYERN